jgi:type I restriction enzyme S subunit
MPGAAPSPGRAEYGDLPAGWHHEQLDVLCGLIRDQIQPSAAAGLPYVGLEHIDSGEPMLKRWGDPEDVRSAKTRFAPGDILYGKLRPYLDKSVLAPFAGICSTDILVFRAQADRAIAEFLVSAIHTKPFLEHAVSTTAGVNHPRTSWNALKVHALAVPPVPEQRAIAEVLRTVQGAKEACERVLAATRQLKQSLLHHLFTYGPVPLADAARVELRTTEFGDVPASWPANVLSDCAHVQTGVAKGRNLDGSEVVELPYLRVANVQDGRLDLTEMKTIQLRQREVARFLLQPGDVVLTEGGDFDKLGRGFIWQGQVSPCVHQNHIFAVRPNRAKLLPEFLAYLAQSSYGKAYFLSVAHKTTNLACINTTKLKALPVLLPPLPEQREIAAQLSAVDAKLAAKEARRAALAAMFQSLLHHLMTGQIRVPLDCGGKRSATPLSPST